jgi:uncharacterized protein (TIGR03663 family)
MGDSMSIKKTVDWPVWALFLVAIAFRVLYLGLKPPHFDEGINGWFVDQLIQNGYYRYDPTNYHGPLHFYVLWIFKVLGGRNLWALRLPAVAFGVGSVWLLYKFKDYLGRPTALAAAWFMAVSPAMVFYSRYSIHETELLFFSLLAFLGYMGLQTKGDRMSLWQIGLGIAGMIVTKETFILHVGTFFIAVFILKFYERYSPSIDAQPAAARTYTPGDLQTVILVNALLIAAFYSGFFIYWQGIADFFRSLLPWLKTGSQGNGHGKPIHYWLSLFYMYEWVALAGLLFSVRLLKPSPRWLRLIAIYGLGVFLAYSIVYYKTPWCILQIIWPFLIVAASILGKAASHGRLPNRIAMTAVGVLVITISFKTADLNFEKYTDEKQPYVYVQTYTPIMEVADILFKAAEKNPPLFHERMHVITYSNWPIPWILGDFTHVGYLGPAAVPADPDGAFIIIDLKDRDKLEAKLRQSYFTRVFRLRSAQDEMVAYFNAEKFKDFFDKNAPVFTPPGKGPMSTRSP